jgi:hypothetical protein
MEENKIKATDLLGIAPYGETLKLAVEKGFEGANALLSRICLPAAEELGLWYQDKVRHWRLNNLIRIINRSQGKIIFDGSKLQIHPRIMHEIIDNGSWCEDGTLQDMWAGMLASSCSSNNPNDSNLLYVNVLKQLTGVQAIIINHICSICKVIHYTEHSLIQGADLHISVDDLIGLTGLPIEQLDAELDDLRAREIIAEGIVITSKPLIAIVTPTAFALNMFVKLNGVNLDPQKFYKDRLIDDPEH